MNVWEPEPDGHGRGLTGRRGTKRGAALPRRLALISPERFRIVGVDDEINRPARHSAEVFGGRAEAGNPDPLDCLAARD